MRNFFLTCEFFKMWIVHFQIQKSFIMFCLNLFCWLSSFFTFQTALQTLELFLFFLLSHWLSMTSLTSSQFISISSSVLFIKAAITLSSSSLSCHVCLVGRCHLFDCVPAPVRKFFFCHPSTQSLCVKGSRAAARVVAKADVTDYCWCCSNDCFQFTEVCPFAKNVSARVKCFQYCVCVIPK